MITVECLDKNQWAVLSEKAHLVCFEETKPKEWDRIDFALLTKREDQLTGYITCREHDAQTLYWQFGGTFPGTRETSLSYKSYYACIEWAKERYKRITTLIENNNLVMLKFALKVGFKIIGVRMYHGKILVELGLEFESA